MGAELSDAATWARLNARTRVAVWEAGEEDSDSVVDTGRLLLSLAASRGSIASAVIAAERIDLVAFAGLHAELREPGPRGSMSASAARAVRSASIYAAAFGDPRAGTGHLLLGVLDELDGVAILVLDVLGVRLRGLVARTRAHLDAARAADAREETAPEEEFVMSGVETLAASPSRVHAAFARKCEVNPYLSLAVAADGVVEVVQASEDAAEFALCFRLEDAVDTTIEWMVALRAPVYSPRHRETLVAQTESQLAERSRQVSELLTRLVLPAGSRQDAADVRP